MDSSAVPNAVVRNGDPTNEIEIGIVVVVMVDCSNEYPKTNLSNKSKLHKKLPFLLPLGRGGVDWYETLGLVFHLFRHDIHFLCHSTDLSHLKESTPLNLLFVFYYCLIGI